MGFAGPFSRRWGARLAAMLAGALLALAFPAPALWWWAYVGLVPVLALVRGAADGRDAAWRSWAAGLGFFTTLHHWLLPYLSVFVLPVGALLGLVWVPWGLTARFLLRPPLRLGRCAAALVVVPSVWVALEFVRSWDRFGGSWGFLGLTQWNVPLVLSVAAIGGVWMLSLLLGITNVAATIVVTRETSPALRAFGLGVAVLVVGGAVAHGGTRPDPSPEGALRVGGVQAGLIHDPAERLRVHEQVTRQLATSDPSIDVLVWGQSSVGFDPARSDEVRQRLVDLAAEVDRQILINVDARRGDGRISKTGIVVEPDGLGETYRKQRLVPFGEYIPLRSVFGWVENVTEAANEDRSPGTDLTTFRLAGTEVGPLISYESTFPDMRRSLARRGVVMTLVQAAATSFQGSWALPQQASFEAVRAVESGRPAVLVAVSGTSTAFDPRGERLAWVPQTFTGGWVVDVPLSREETPFVRWGPFVPVAALVVSLLASLVVVADLWRRRGSDRSSAP